MKEQITPTLLKEFIRILENGVVPREDRFKLLKKAYLAEEKVNEECVSRFKLHQIYNEMRRLNVIGESKEVLLVYFKSQIPE